MISSVRLLAFLLILCFAPFGQAADPMRIRFVVAAPTFTSAHATHTSLPQALGYWKEEGLDVVIETSQGSNQAVQLITLEQADVGSPSPEPVLIGRAKGSKVKAVYVYARRAVYSVGVLDASPIRKLADLKAKAIGIPNLGSGVVPFVKAIVQREGMDPDKDISLLPVGLGAMAGASLIENRVAALAFFDAAFSGIENLGYKIRYLDNALESNLYGVVIAFSEDFIKLHPQAVVGFLRGIAKATLFALTNPEAAVRIHAKVYPQYRSKAPDEATAMRYDLNVFKRRAIAYRLESPDLLWGSYEPKKWEIFQDFLLGQGALQKKLPIGEFFDDRFIKPANDFDREAVIKAARAAK